MQTNNSYEKWYHLLLSKETNSQSLNHSLTHLFTYRKTQTHTYTYIYINIEHRFLEKMRAKY